MVVEVQLLANIGMRSSRKETGIDGQSFCFDASLPEEGEHAAATAMKAQTAKYAAAALDGAFIAPR
jgi:hypothetical protein